MNNSRTFITIGSGSVATHLSKALVASGMSCRGVYSRTKTHAEELARALGSKCLASVDEAWESDVDFVLLAVSDNALVRLSEEMSDGRAIAPIVLHTSGATPMDVLQRAKDHGVLYPLQTFSKEREITVSDIPLFLEASSSRSRVMLEEIAHALGTKQITFCNSLQRRHLHVAAVFACNFVNHMYASAYEVMDMGDLPPETLMPLMKETLNKLNTMSPTAGQTGPAVRGDSATIERHLELLQNRSDLSLLYTEVSRSITDKYSKHNRDKGL